MDEPASAPRKRKRKRLPPKMSGDMRRSDAVLSKLGFSGNDVACLLVIDRPVRDYIVRALQQR